MKVICVALLALSAVGCSSNCKDGYGSFFFWSRGTYRACAMGCAPEESARNPEASGNVSVAVPNGWGTEEIDPQECRCSAACPCWKRHK